MHVRKHTKSLITWCTAEACAVLFFANLWQLLQSQEETHACQKAHKVTHHMVQRIARACAILLFANPLHLLYYF